MKVLISALCGVGVALTAYGLYADHDAIFVLGLVQVVAGYALLRRRLKAFLQQRGDHRGGV